MVEWRTSDYVRIFKISMLFQTSCFREKFLSAWLCGRHRFGLVALKMYFEGYTMEFQCFKMCIYVSTTC